MTIRNYAKKLFSAGMSLAMALSLSTSVLANDKVEEKDFTEDFGTTEVENNSRVSGSLRLDTRVDKEALEPVQIYEDDEIVRVSIVLEKESTIAKGFSTEDIAKNAQARNYRAQLQADQDAVTNAIEQSVDGIGKLDVAWNLTLAANIISANVKYGMIKDIKNVAGVKDVVLETRYERPIVETEGSADPEMSTSSSMISSNIAWAEGYTGAGSRIAIIDTGIDMDHQSFDAEAFEYALEKNAELADADPDEYIESLDLLDAEEIDTVIDQLNAKTADYSSDLTASEVYKTSKIAYGYNYVDMRADYIDHNDASDEQGEHGSHVAGIATANKYIENRDGTFSSALEKVFTQGVAPDAQLLVMKVFGIGGGAYDSDYMAGIEDAIVLGADAVNLSLGSAAAGFSREINYYYSDVLDNIAKSGTVVSISMGNAASIADNAYAYPYLYSDDTNYHSGGSPGSYTNALTVASVDNTGFTGPYIKQGDNLIFYTESVDYGNAPILSISGEHEYVYVDGPGIIVDDNDIIVADQFAAVAEKLSGKIGICNRGTSSFYMKANGAVESGAIATIIANNTDGTIGMNLTGYLYSAPAVSITQADGVLLKKNAASSEKVTYGAGTAYEGTVTVYYGTFAVSSDIAVINSDPDYYTMSSFTSWGVPSSLELKPEITAPGGNIYSVNGAVEGGTSYENMSGTSMAAPQVTGMSAVVAQYIRENNLDEKTGLSARVLAQSLLMGTAVPVIEDLIYNGADYGDGYYPVLQQGAGLANVGNAVKAKAYILMDEDANAGAADGKVKAELGASEDGKYSYGFTVYNLTDEELHYYISTDIFTQDLAGSVSGHYLTDSWTWVMDEEEAVVKHSADTITLPANGSVKVSVDIDVSKAIADISDYFPNGFYVQGYTYVTPADETKDGEIADVEQSIPLLGFAGDWSAASMYDRGSFEEEMTYGLAAMGYPYSFAPYAQRLGGKYYANNIEYDGGYMYTVNPYVYEDEIPYGREAIRSDVTLEYYYVRAIRNGSISAAYVQDEDGNFAWMEEPILNRYGAFYHSRYGWLEQFDDDWYYFGTGDELGFTAEELGFKEDDKFSVNVISVPEYYTMDVADEDLNKDYLQKLIKSDTLGDGVYLTTNFKVDDTEPEIISVETEGSEMIIKAKDNNYIAYVTLISDEYEELVEGVVPEQSAPNEECEVKFDLSGISGSYYLVVADYAANEAYADFYSEEIELNLTEAEMPTESTLQLTANVDATWTSSDEEIATVDENGLVTALRYGKVTITAASVASPASTATCEIQTRFYDVNDDSKYYYTPVYWAADNEITTGYDRVYFGPQKNCTRQELAIFLWRLAGKPEVSGTLPFSDTKYDESSASFQAILWCSQQGIVKGYSDGTFKPKANIERKDAMIMLYRLAGKPDVSGTIKFPDVVKMKLNKNSDTYKAILWGVNNGITNGYKDGNFKPKAKCLREHIVTFIYRADKIINQ